MKGSLSVYIEPTVPENVAEQRTWYVERRRQLFPVFVKEISARGSRAYVSFEDIDSFDRANDLRACDLYLPRDTRPSPRGGQFYDDEIVGFTVVDARAGRLGSVSGSRPAGQNRLIVVQDGDREILIPVNSPFIQSVEMGEGILHVDLPDGFLEI